MNEYTGGLSESAQQRITSMAETDKLPFTDRRAHRFIKQYGDRSWDCRCGQNFEGSIKGWNEYLEHLPQDEK